MGVDNLVKEVYAHDTSADHSLFLLKERARGMYRTLDKQAATEDDYVALFDAVWHHSASAYCISVELPNSAKLKLIRNRRFFDLADANILKGLHAGSIKDVVYTCGLTSDEEGLLWLVFEQGANSTPVRTRSLSLIDAEFIPLSYYVEEALAANGVASVLDVGCGRGIALTGINNKFGSRVQAYGIDLHVDADMAAKENITVKKADVRISIPFPPEHFDLAYSVQVMRYMDDTERRAVLKNIRQVLKPGGRFVFEDEVHRHEEYTSRDVHYTSIHYTGASRRGHYVLTKR